MSKPKQLMSPITILMIVIAIAVVATWLIPAGQYDTLAFDNGNFILHTKTGDSTISVPGEVPEMFNIHIAREKFESGAIRKAVAIPGSFHFLPSNRQGIVDFIESPLKGVLDSIDIILFVLIIGAFINVFNSTGALVAGLSALSRRLKGRESLMIIILTSLFSLGGASFGMAEEGLAFYAVLTPLFLAAGYDVIVPVAVIFGGTQLGTLSSFTNPFATIIASNAAGVNWTDGIAGRICMFIITTGIFIWYILRYANKVKKDPSRSLTGIASDNEIFSPQKIESAGTLQRVSRKHKILLLVFALTFTVMVGGVVWLDWWLLEMSAVFLTSSVLIGIIARYGERKFIDLFIKGAESILSVAFIIGIARGVTFILNEGKVSDTILYYSANLVSNMPASVFIVALLMLFMLFTLFIASSSGMAVLTMPIMGALAIIVNIPGREIVNTYLFGMGIMGFLTPTGLMLPSLAICNAGVKAWWKFIYPFLIILFVICAVALIIGIRL